MTIDLAEAQLNPKSLILSQGEKNKEIIQFTRQPLRAQRSRTSGTSGGKREGKNWRTG